jgi:nucleoside-diphosphate-sugar epimerase
MKINKKIVLITGASGFLGKYVIQQFLQKDYKVVTFGRTKVNASLIHISGNITDKKMDLPDLEYEKVIHIAGKAHVFPKTEKERQSFFEINAQGTQNLLDNLVQLKNSPKMIINVSTVAVYGKNFGEMINENTPVNPSTSYGKSKLEGEHMIVEWAKMQRCNALNLRLPLIAGNNPPGTLGNMISAIENKRYPRIKDNKAKKSIVLASDIALFMEKVDESKSGSYNLTDGIHPSINQIENAIEKSLNKPIKINIPNFFLLKLAAKIGDFFEFVIKKEMPISSLRLAKLTSDLTFDDQKARRELGWTSNSSLDFLEQIK